ncbi:MAG TPA: hypothetical protein VMS17_24060 [Gemmataceae bacterium]|nr:hypothetical protein [Gemmataceae bacterium]
MRKAYGGRAAAYEKEGDYGRAAADYGMIVFSYAVELDVADPKSDGYEDLLLDAAKAYRTRAACLEAKGDSEAAGRDRRRADKLDAKLKSAAAKDRTETPAAPVGGQVTLRNDYSETLTVVIDGASYKLRVGETKTLPSPAGTFPYELRWGSQSVAGTLDAGKAYSLGASRPTAP